MANSKMVVRDAADAVADNVKAVDLDKFYNLLEKTFDAKKLSIKALAGLTDEKEASIYSQAFLLYNTGRYKDASEIFRVLIMANAQEPKYMMGLAACFHMQKNYNAAAQLYMIVSTLDPKSPIPYFHASDCHIQLEDPVTASIMLQMAIKHAEGKPEFKVLKERCEITLSGLKKEVKEVL